MGNPVTAYLAYGTDLGNTDDFRAIERDSYGGPGPAWYDPAGPDFADQLYDRLHTMSGLPPEPHIDTRHTAATRHYGVEISYCGTDDYRGWILIASGSEREACNAEVLTLNLLDLEIPPHEWFERLETALEHLGITPTQPYPGWLVYPYHG